MEPKCPVPILFERGAGGGGNDVFVVRIQNDEATMYRPFRRLQAARQWVVERDNDDFDYLIDILAVAETEDADAEIEAARLEKARLVVRTETILYPFLPGIEASGDIRFSHSATAGR